MAPWDLTDAIDAGDTAGALVALRRLLGRGGRSTPSRSSPSCTATTRPCSGSTAPASRHRDEAAARLGMRSAFPARKALEQGRRLGPAGISRAVTLLADADLDVRGRSALPPETVLEVLVGRLSRLGANREAPAPAALAAASRRRS